MSSSANLQSTDINTTELNANFPENCLNQFQVTEPQVQHITKSIDDVDFTCTDLTLTSCTVIPSMQTLACRNYINESTKKVSSSIDKSHNSDESDSGSSNNVIVGNVGDGYQNPSQKVLQDHAESHQYTELIRERHSATSFSEPDKTEEQGVETRATKKDEYMNLQF